MSAREPATAANEGRKTELCARLEFAEKPFFMGQKPTAIDATVYAFLAAIAEAPFESPVKEACLKRSNLMAYCARMGERFFPHFRGCGA